MDTKSPFERNKQKKEKISNDFKFGTNIIKNIKSKYILNGVLSYLYENKKLELIKYNKKCQKLFIIDFNYYKQISGKYLNGERNGNGKEYDDNDNLLFEGGYLNGKRNGKGKEYDSNGNLIFEGVYLNDKKWDGKGYNGPNKIIYELIQGNGKIKEYVNGTLLFEGEYLNGEKIGKCKEYDK